jgi:type I restriction enzyme S subunit
MAACEAETGRLDPSRTRPFGELRRKSFRHFQEGDVVMAKITPSMENGKAALARNLVAGQAFGSTEFHVLRPSAELDAQFLLHFLLQRKFRADAARRMTGTAGQLRVPADFLRQAPLPLPPLDQQRRIVEAVQEQFSRLDAGVDSLRRARRQLARLRSSAIDALVDRKYPLVPMGTIAKMSLGKMLDRKRMTGAHGRPYLRNVNVRWFEFDLSDIATMDVPPHEFERVSVRPGDLVVCEGGEPGRCAVWDGEPMAIQKALHRVRPGDGVLAKYLAIVVRWWVDQPGFERFVTGTTIKHVPKEKLEQMPVPLPPIEEQSHIVREVERQFSIADATAKTINEGLKRAAALRQTILSDAFAGRLIRPLSVSSVV